MLCNVSQKASGRKAGLRKVEWYNPRDGIGRRGHMSAKRLLHTGAIMSILILIGVGDRLMLIARMAAKRTARTSLQNLRLTHQHPFHRMKVLYEHIQGEHMKLFHISGNAVRVSRIQWDQP